jgi:hypothetical protein
LPWDVRLAGLNCAFLSLTGKLNTQTLPRILHNYRIVPRSKRLRHQRSNS